MLKCSSEQVRKRDQNERQGANYAKKVRRMAIQLQNQKPS